jgi:hypothetical protein
MDHLDSVMHPVANYNVPDATKEEDMESIKVGERAENTTKATTA